MKVVIAYSGGLDTSVALHWLATQKGYDVYAYCANVGQSDDLDAVKRRALETGATDVLIEDLREDFLSDFAFPSVRANVVYDRQYLLAAPLSRPLICQGLVRYARAVDADAVAHGATGKGNDQVRFLGGIGSLDPGLEVLTPVIDWEMTSRTEEIEYAVKNGISGSFDVERSYSVDTNIWGTSIECGELDDITQPPPSDVYLMTSDQDAAAGPAFDVTIDFSGGVPVGLNGERMAAVDLVDRLNVEAGRHGVGRVDIIENRVVGIKTRGVYECPAGTVLHAAHRELEASILDRDTLHLSEILSQRYGTLVYDGHWFSPLRAGLEAYFAEVQAPVTGSVALRLYRGTVTTQSRRPTLPLYHGGYASYGTDDKFDHRAGAGFAYANTLPMRLRALMNSSPTSDS